MLELKGKYASAKIFTGNAEATAVKQVEELLEMPFASGSTIRIMPDVHAGMGCTIGTTMTITNKVVPNMVGVDIGCGMETAVLKEKKVKPEAIDKAVHQYIPSGFKTRKKPHPFNDKIDLSKLRSAKSMDIERAILSIGTLGGGNHFIELGQDDDGQLYLVVHSGSRNLGKQVCEHYQKIAIKELNAQGAGRALAYLEGENFDDYLHDMAIMQKYADINRQAMIFELGQVLDFTVTDRFSTIHNYIDMDAMILRKGAISAKKGERMLIPMNMRDGSLICIGKGNPDWNYSAPHGAGRIMSRTAAKQKLALSDFTASMKGIYSTTVNKSTLDEAPFAYKPMNEIISNINDTAEIIKTIKPLYNFKAAD